MAEDINEVTVLYYDQDDMTSIRSDVLSNCHVSEASRVIFPKDFRENKIIVAVLDGNCNLRNSLGDRNIYY